MSTTLKQQDAGTSESDQRSLFTSEQASESALAKAKLMPVAKQAESSDKKKRPETQQADESPGPVPGGFVESYTIGWICALPEEFQVAKQMLDQKNLPKPEGTLLSANDNNTYTYGKIGEHFVVVGCLPRGRIGLVNAANVATSMVRSFPSLKFALLVGVGGGAPTRQNDVRLGDVVVSTPCLTHGGVVQLDFGARLSNGLFERRGHLNGVPDALLSATGTLGGHFDDPDEPDKIAQHMARMDHNPGFQRPAHDYLFISNYEHVVAESDESEDDADWTNPTTENSCHRCDGAQLKLRLDRDIEHRKIRVHYGTIASGNCLLRDAKVRDKHAKDKSLRVLCFEMEAAGLMNSLPCIVIRGVSDYADSHKNDEWRKYAALSAAAYARELLLVMEVQSVVALPSWASAIDQISKDLVEVKEGQQEQTRHVLAEGQKAEDHRNMQKLIELRNGLEHPDQAKASNDTYETANNLDGTCEWLFVRKEFRTWVDTNAHPILWLSGKHGAGKTVLCAAAIRHLLKFNGLPVNSQQTLEESPVHCSRTIVWQFFSKDEYITLRRQFEAVAYQLVNSFLSTNPATVPSTIQPFLIVRHDTCEKLQNLIKVFLSELPQTFIFVDGLDEAEYAEPPKYSSSVGRQPHNEVNKFVEFLIQQAHDQPSRVRVWLSSQPLPTIRQYICDPRWVSGVQEIQMTTDDTKRDIARFFRHNMPVLKETDKIKLAQQFLLTAVNSEVEGSFLWAAHMAGEFDTAEDVDDLVELATTDLPLNMRDIYARIMDRIVRNDSGLKATPLWRVVLSLLAFARRPMRLKEVMEAVAIHRTMDGFNIKQDSATGEQILRCGLSLVRHTPATDLLRFSHSSVRAFLLDPPAETGRSEPFADLEIVQICCLRYLMQPKYESMLRKAQPGQVSLANGNADKLSHRFLSYAAKYWYLHYDIREEYLKESTTAAILKFLISKNFCTILQVQSISIECHFLLRFHYITGKAESARQTLPNWVSRKHNELYRQYNAFQGEWWHLLQCRESFRGELDRCFWRALGHNSFLCCGQGRYQDFEFRMPESTWSEGDSGHSHCLSPNGTLLWLAWIRTREKQLCFEEWALDGKQDPYLKASTIIPFSTTETDIDRYVFPCSENFRTISIITETNSLVPPNSISIFENGSMIRLGRQIFKKVQIGTPNIDENFHQISGPIAKDAWELICYRAPFTVVCRRRLLRKEQNLSSLRNERARVERMKQWMSRNEEARATSRRSDELYLFRKVRKSLLQGLSRRTKRRLGHVSDSSSETSYSSGHDTESTDFESDNGDIGLAEDSWSEGSVISDEDPTDTLSSPDGDGYFREESDEDSGLGSPGPESEESSSMSLRFVNSDSSQRSYSPDSSDFVSSEGDEENVTSSSDYLRSEDDVSVDDILDAKPAPLQQESGSRVSIKQDRKKISCSSCNKRRLRTWYHCLECREGKFNICEYCERKGVWCLDSKHQLYKIVKHVPLKVVSRGNFDVCQELAAFQTDMEGNQIAAFRFKKRYSVFLHDSPPVIHETYPLVVWALTGSRLVFGDMAQNKYFEQKINTLGYKQGRPICVNLSFSPCGTILRMAVIDAVAEKPKTPRRTQDTSKSQLCLRLNVLMLQLSSSKPARTLPKLLDSISCRLDSSCARAFVSTIPFAFTWSSSDIYLTISESHLLVYRISLPIFNPDISSVVLEGSNIPMNMGQRGKKVGSRIKIYVLRQTVLLPYSSRHRSVQFFPAQADESESKAKVVIGPYYNRNPTPPIGVYLSETDLGGWVDLADKEDERGRMCESQQELADQFEEGWDSDDCIIIPFDG